MKARRGLSSVVGMVFAIIALTTTISYIGYSMDTIEGLNQVIITKGIENIDKIEEDFDILTANTTASGKFNIAIQNTGNIPINFTRLWVQNITHPTDWVSYYTINEGVYPGSTIGKIGDNLELSSKSDQSYKLKLTTERGNSKEFFINSARQQPLYITLDATPSYIASEFTTTVTMTVVNNMSSNNLLLNLQPKAMGTSCSGLCTTETKLSGPEPASFDSLKSGDTATFTWIYELDGAADDVWTFTGELNDGYTGNTASADATIKDVDVGSLEVSDTFLLAFGRDQNIGMGVNYGQFFTNVFSPTEDETYIFLGFSFKILEVNVYLGESKDSGTTLDVIVRDDGVDVPNTTVSIPQDQTGQFSSGPISEVVLADSYINLKFDNDISSSIKHISVIVECERI